MSGNAFAVLAKLGDKKKNIVVDATTSSKPISKPKEKKEPVEKVDNKKAAPAATKKAAVANSNNKKGEALGAVKVGGPSSLAKVAAASKVQEVKETEALKQIAEKKEVAEARRAEYKKKKEEEAAANAKPEEEKTEEEKEADRKAAEYKKKKEEEDNIPKVGMKEFQKELEAKRFLVENKAARHVDPNQAKGKSELKTFNDNDGLQIKKEQPKPKTTGKNAKAPAPQQKTAPKKNKAETINFMDLAAKQGNYGPRRGRNPRGDKKFGEEEEQQSVPTDAAFPDLA